MSTNWNSALSRNDFSSLPDQGFIKTQVLLAHPTCSEAIFESLATHSAVNRTDLSNCIHRGICIGHDESSYPLLDYFGYRTVWISNHWRAASKGFDHYDSKRF